VQKYLFLYRPRSSPHTPPLSFVTCPPRAPFSQTSLQASLTDYCRRPFGDDPLQIFLPLRSDLPRSGPLFFFFARPLCSDQPRSPFQSYTQLFAPNCAPDERVCLSVSIPLQHALPPPCGCSLCAVHDHCRFLFPPYLMTSF